MQKVWLADMRHPEVARLLEGPHIGVLPIGSTEQHGPHLPLDVDTRIAAAMCEAAALRVVEEIGVAIAPPLSIGVSEHHMRFPGTLSVDAGTFVELLVQTGTSLVRHGFDRLAIVNGHAGNVGAMHVAAARLRLDGGAKRVVHVSEWTLAAEAFATLRESGPGGCAHACEYETSVYLHLDADAVAARGGGGRDPGARGRRGHDRPVRGRAVCGGAGPGRLGAAACSATRRSRPPKRAAPPSRRRSRTSLGCIATSPPDRGALPHPVDRRGRISSGPPPTAARDVPTRRDPVHDLAVVARDDTGVAGEPRVHRLVTRIDEQRPAAERCELSLGRDHDDVLGAARPSTRRELLVSAAEQEPLAADGCDDDARPPPPPPAARSSALRRRRPRRALARARRPPRARSSRARAPHHGPGRRAGPDEQSRSSSTRSTT